MKSVFQRLLLRPAPLMQSIIASILLYLVLIHTAGAAESILDYHASIDLQEDGQVTVTETIKVKAEGNKIRRGIYRDFPTDYKDRFGNRYRVRFGLIDSYRDGRPETHRVERRENGYRVYLGNANTLLRPGEYTYRIRYITDRQIGFFDDYDELYWNVTGNGWVFPIQRAHGEFLLPAAAADKISTGSDFQFAVYTGRQGGRASNGVLTYQGIQNGRPVVSFSTTQRLGSYEGLTIAAGFPKGIVQEPSLWQKLAYFFKDNLAALWAGIGIIIVAFYFWRSWNQVGRDPAKGTIIPEYKPPHNLSPAACYYVLHMGMGQQAVSAAMISCAVKGHLRINQEGKRDFSIERLQPDQSEDQTEPKRLSPGEHRLLSKLINVNETLELDNEHHQRFSKAQSALMNALEIEYHQKLFNKNSGYWWKGILISVVVIVGTIILKPNPIVVLPVIAVLVLMNALFYWLLKAPTRQGRRVMDKIEGFKMYLGTAEKDRLDRMRAPEVTPEVFEMFLPYAFALGVENVWCQRFEDQLKKMNQSPNDYHPTWYHGHGLAHTGLSAISQDLGSSWSSAISSASTAPGSSSGSGGGGSSGGGGGGGGGGGW